MKQTQAKPILLDRIEQLMAVDLKGQEMVDYQQQAIILLIEIMRLTNGDEFTLGFLAGATRHIKEGKPFIEKVRTH